MDDSTRTDDIHARGPFSREEAQHRTRAALLSSARRVFGRDGFHGAGLDAIASDAGLTKGAVYSNFDSKADLFLAILAEDLDALESALAKAPDGAWNPAERFDLLDRLLPAGATIAELPSEFAEPLGIGLATLEFAAVAARDPALRTALASHLERLHAAFVSIARARRREGDRLSPEQVAMLLMAFDHGAMITWLAGAGRIDGGLARDAIDRLAGADPGHT